MKSIGSQMAGQVVQSYLKSSPLGGGEGLRDVGSSLRRCIETIESHMQGLEEPTPLDQRVMAGLERVREESPAAQLAGLVALSLADKTPPEIAAGVLDLRKQVPLEADKLEIAKGGTFVLKRLADQSTKLGVMTTLVIATTPAFLPILQGVADLAVPSHIEALSGAASQLCARLESGEPTDPRETLYSLATIGKMAGKLGQSTVQMAIGTNFKPSDDLAQLEAGYHGMAKAISHYRGPDTSPSEMAGAILSTPGRGKDKQFQSAALQALKTLLGERSDRILPEIVPDPGLALEILAHSRPL